ncbi:Neuroligin-4, Y-linked [Folsomia candida]|uniref:Neuroligin-4, Y-linked n=1 Tax=Folsomia candida TaxID=158441 RepID=A0A226DNG7_FOLCA|nr:Neuroligin-4, Y-linked [Folsomia candida]
MTSSILFSVSIHRNEIMAACLHEYTDWERPIQHPISVRDETLDALADAQIVAPLVKLGDLHSQSNSKSYFYVFEYQSKISDYQQDLLYIFGVPLYFSGNEFGQHGKGGSGGGAESEDEFPKLGFFTGNYSRNEVQLSQTVIGYWANFIRSGNPNDDKLEGESLLPNGGSGSGRTGNSNEKSSKSRIVEWPQYDPLYKKYLTIDMKPRVRTHYRAHKLSFWLHLVPDLQKNGYGAPSGHHTVNANPFPPSSSSSANIPSHPNSGLVILPPEDSTHNSSTPSPPTIQLVGPGPPMWEHNPNQQHGNFYPGPEVDVDGFQMYSTALSVTIAIGCSLLILNILIFAAFYYQRDKRRAEEMDNSPSRDPNSQSMSSMSHHSPHHHTHGGVTYTKADVTSMGGGRRKENGQAIQMASHPGSGGQTVQMPMPNICGELPPFDNSSSDGGYGQCHSGHHQAQYHNPQGGGGGGGGTMKRKQQQNATQTSYEMPMPDAVLAASMMSVKFDDSPECSVKSGTCGGTLRRSSLTMKDQLPNQGHFSVASGSGGGNGSYESGSRTVPRPPKRTTPTVKFGPETNLESPTGSGSGSTSVGVGPAPPPGFASQTLKPSLKKTLNYSPNADELRV